jgi:hypothetical protein
MMRSRGHTYQAGIVAFQRLDDTHTRVALRLDHDPEGLAEKAADALGIIETRIKDDLENFKHFIEDRGTEEGGWRGDVGRGPQKPATQPEDDGPRRPSSTDLPDRPW